MFKTRLFSEYRMIYSPTDDYPNTMRFIIELKDNIKFSSLRFAINMIKKRYPYLCIELKKDDDGFYFIKNDREIVLEKRGKEVLLNSLESNYHFMAFSYDDKHITYDMSHAIADGNTAYEVIRTLLYYYISNAYQLNLSKENIRLVEDDISEEEYIDPLLKYKGIKTENVVMEPALSLFKNADEENKTHWHLSIEEKELLDIAKTLKASPGTLMLILLGKAIYKLNKDSEYDIRLSLCYDLRKVLNTPLAHNSLVGSILYTYNDDISLEEAIKELRENIKSTIKPENANKLLNNYVGLLTILSELKDDNVIKQLIESVNYKTSSLVTSSLSYVGKANFGDAEKYITDFVTIANVRIGVLLELAAVNNKFYLDFIQNIEGEEYFNSFIQELNNINIKYEIKEKIEVNPAKIKRVI
ncbi:MAG: hypothetical protein IKR19_10400 [Acholeplasmatales bacterium]|nr:hypothetical protein [Acholeplasmatales bacterium]